MKLAVSCIGFCTKHKKKILELFLAEKRLSHFKHDILKKKKRSL
jgi:hypothetical protein